MFTVANNQLWNGVWKIWKDSVLLASVNGQGGNVVHSEQHWLKGQLANRQVGEVDGEDGSAVVLKTVSENTD